jgi:hypothetical protein
MSNLQSVSKPMNTAFSQSVLRQLVLSVIGIAIAHFCFTAPAFAQGVSLGTAQSGIVCGVIASSPESENSPATFFTGVDAQESTENHSFDGCPNLFAGGLQLLGLIVGVPMVLFGMMQMAAGSQDAMKRVMFGGAALGATMIAPSAMNMLMSIWC